jgi:hypothetical protein
MPTPDELAAQIRTWVIQGNVFADEVAALDTTPEPQPEPEPEPLPKPQPTPPAKPTGLACVIGPDMKPVLTWDNPGSVDEWDVRDENNLTKPVQVTVTQPRSTRSPLKPGQHRRYTVVARNAAGESEPSDAVDVPPAAEPDPTPGAARYPADIVGPNWYITLPTGRQGSPDTVHQPEFATYSSRYFELTEAHDGVVFRCWHGGVTTSGSSNPRSELREMVNGGADKAAWSCTTGTHAQTVVGQVNRLTKVRPHLVLWQIHGADRDVTVFRVEGTNLWITNGNDPHGHLVTDSFRLGERYELKGEAANGQVHYWYNGQPIDYTVRATDTGCYFKAGAYAQTNPQSAPSESTTEYDEVVIYRVTVSHI